MVTIDKRYLVDYEIRSNTTVISEVLCALMVDNFIIQNTDLIVGDRPEVRLPDIYTSDMKIGFEVTKCELKTDFCHNDILRELQNIDYKYDTFENEKSNGNSLFKNERLKITISGNKITSSTMGGVMYGID